MVQYIIATVGWLGYSKETLEELCQKYLDLGFTAFKVKVGKNLQDDIQRLTFVRNAIGWDKILVSTFIIADYFTVLL